MRIPAGRRRIAADVLLRALAEEQPAQLDHAREVAGLAAGVAGALAELRRCAGTQFGPRVVHAFCLAVEALPSRSERPPSGSFRNRTHRRVAHGRIGEGSARP